MKHLSIKILISMVVLIIGIVIVYQLIPDNRSEDSGTIYLSITDADEVTLFEGELGYVEGDTFYDILNRHFDLTCANANYQEDASCSYVFQSFAYQGHVILGIKGENFELMTDWSHTFLSFYHYENGIKRLATVGPSNLPFENGDQFVIQYEAAWE